MTLAGHFRRQQTVGNTTMKNSKSWKGHKRNTRNPNGTHQHCCWNMCETALTWKLKHQYVVLFLIKILSWWDFFFHFHVKTVSTDTVRCLMWKEESRLLRRVGATSEKKKYCGFWGVLKGKMSRVKLKNNFMKRLEHQRASDTLVKNKSVFISIRSLRRLCLKAKTWSGVCVYILYMELKCRTSMLGGGGGWGYSRYEVPNTFKIPIRSI